RLRLSKKRQSRFFEQNAVRRAQDLSALGGQILHLRPEKCFLRRRSVKKMCQWHIFSGGCAAVLRRKGRWRRRKQIPVFSRLRARTLRDFFDTLRKARRPCGRRAFLIHVP